MSRASLSSVLEPGKPEARRSLVAEGWALNHRVGKVFSKPPPPASGVVAHGLPAGTRAPELDLPSTPDGRRVRLSIQRGGPAVLVFYPGDFAPVCTRELGLFAELVPVFSQFDATVFGISCDSVWSHIAFARELHLQFPLLSDFDPKGEVSRRYDVYREDAGICERGLYVIDGKGFIYWSHVSPRRSTTSTRCSSSSASRRATTRCRPSPR